MFNKLARVMLALCFACAAVAPALAGPVGEPYPTSLTTSGVFQTLANNVSASANQIFPVPNALGRPRVVTLCMSASAATTFTVTESADNATYYQATLPDTATNANYAPASSGTLCETVTPASYYKVQTSAAVTVTIQLQAAY